MGELSDDQKRYAEKVGAGVPLDLFVVEAWIACESGWGVTKPGHNYLNVGPGRSYPSTDAAARDAIDVAHQSNMNIGGATPKEQLASIVASAWDAGHYGGGCLQDTYDSLDTTVGGDPLGLPDPGDIAGSLIDWTGLGSVLSDFANSIGEVLLTIALGFVFTTAALGLIVLGVSRLTGRSVSDNARSVASTATSAAAIAATV